MNYISKQLQCKLNVPKTERTEMLNGYPRVSDWLHTVGVRSDIVQVSVPFSLVIGLEIGTLTEEVDY